MIRFLLMRSAYVAAIRMDGAGQYGFIEVPLNQLEDIETQSETSSDESDNDVETALRELIPHIGTLRGEGTLSIIKDLVTMADDAILNSLKSIEWENLRMMINARV